MSQQCGWDQSITALHAGIERLKRAIETCKEMKANGVLWPGAEELARKWTEEAEDALAISKRKSEHRA